MPNIPILFTFDEKVLLPAVISIKSLIDSANEETVYNIHVMHPGFSDQIIAAFLKIVEKTRHTIEFYFVDKKEFKNAPIQRGGWNEILYYRLLASKVLSNLDKVIYSDIDVFFKKDLSEVFNIDIADYQWAGVIAEFNNEHTSCHKYFPENKNEFIYMSGFMVMNLKKMRDDNLIEKFYKTIETIGNRLYFFDLDVLNISCNKIKAIPFEYVTLEEVYSKDDITKASEFPWLNKFYSRDELEYAKANPVIIHYAGKLGKPWKRKNIPQYYKKYMANVPKLLNNPDLKQRIKNFLYKIF